MSGLVKRQPSITLSIGVEHSRFKTGVSNLNAREDV